MSVTQISARDAFELLQKDKNSVLVDVRTFEEFNFVGFVSPSLFNNRLILLPWQLYPEMNENPDFVTALQESLEKIFNDNAKQHSIVFMCRSGARSNAAAHYAVNLGYQNCYNLTSGFEGEPDEEGHRGRINGWKADNLPWRQK